MRIKILFLLGVMIGWAVFHAGHAQAASTIAIEPTRIELALKPGQTATNKLRVSNRGKKPIYVEISTQAFSVVNEKYDYQFSEAEELSKWLKFNQTSAEIEPNKTLYIEYQIAVPNNAAPGGRYLAVFASVTGDEDNSNIVGRAGQMIYLTVSGSFKKDGQLLDVNVPMLVFNRNVNWSYRVRNTGTVHFYSPLQTKLLNIFLQPIKTDKTDHLIMPNSIRLIDESLHLSAWPGIYILKADIGAADRPPQHITRPILFMPVPFILLLMLIIYWLIRLARHRKNHKKAI